MSARRTAGRVIAPIRRRLVRGEPMVPGYLVVGTKRGGSTSVADWIARHPEVGPCRANKGTHYFDVNHGRGWAWYLSWFPRAADGWRTTGEASPYYMFHPSAPSRMAAALPDARLVVTLREPVARAWSHHAYEKQQGFEERSFEEAIELEPTRLAGEEQRLLADPAYESFSHRHHAYVQRGHYAEQLERLYEHFDPEQVLVLCSESLFSDPQAQLSRVWRHLGVSDVELGEFGRLKATDRSSAAMDSLTRERLLDHYRPWNERLARLPGVDFTWDAKC